jgi:Cd2+/Zn2+-exporting ATPase
MAFFGGIGGAASRGILYKGGNVFSKIARAEVACFDKTGTLTTGRFSVSRVDAFGIDETDLLSLAASCEYISNHPIAECIRNSSPSAAKPTASEEIAGKGVVATVTGKNVAVGNIELMNSLSVDLSQSSHSENGLFVSVDGMLRGVIHVSDTVKDEAKIAISAMRSLGIKNTVTLSGDRYENAEYVSSLVGIDNTFAPLSPEEKYRKLEGIIKESDNRTIYVGDGINDAPALALADVGISMGSIGQDSAIEASDIVIMSDDLMRIPEAILISRKTINISKQNIIFALGTKGVILLLGAFGIANMWFAVFADVGVAVLAILNSMRALKPPKIKRS